MKRLMFLFGVLGICSILFLHSCKKESLSDVNNPNKSLLYSINDKEEENAGIFWIDKISDFHQIDIILDNGISGDVIQDIVIYSNKTHANISDIDAESIVGFSVYYTIQEKNIHKAFINDNEVFNELESLTSEISGVSTNDCKFVMNELQRLNRDICCYYVVKSNESSYFESGSHLRLKRVKNAHVTLDKDVPGGNSAGDCANPCDPDPDYCDCIVHIDDDVPGEDPIDPCEPCMCSAAYLSDDNDVTSNYSQDYIAQNLNLPLFYQFRDDVLLNYNIGIKYYDYYKVLSDFVVSENLLTFNKKMSVLAKMPSIVSVVNNILNPISSNEIVITQDIKNDLLYLANLFYEETNNTDFKAILDDIKFDINQYAGLSYEELFEVIN